MTESNQPNLESFSRTQILSFMAITALILLIIAQLWQKLALIAVIPVKFTSTAILQGVMIAIIIVVASSILSFVWEDYRHSAEKYLDLIITPLVMIDLVWVGLLPGLSEELLFRGVMIPALGYDWLALIMSSIFFGVLHWNSAANWHYVVWAVVIGFILGVSAYVTGNLLVPIIAHALTNFTSSLMWKLKKS